MTAIFSGFEQFNISLRTAGAWAVLTDTKAQTDTAVTSRSVAPSVVWQSSVDWVSAFSL